MSVVGVAAGGAFQILTSAGPAAIAVVRVWGRRTDDFARRHIRTVRAQAITEWAAGDVLRAALLDIDGAPLDDILVTVHAGAPAHELRLHLHGNPWLVRRCAELLRESGVHEASADEAAPLWPARDALAAEAWERLPHMQTGKGAHWLLGQVELLRTTLADLIARESIERAQRACLEMAERLALVDWFVRPVRIALVGPPNVGKSALANALANRPVSVVSPTPGTTRDWVEFSGELQGFPATWLDTAGLRTSVDPLEQAGVERTRAVIRAADAVLVVLEVTTASETGWQPMAVRCTDVPVVAVVANKVDLGEPTAALYQALPEDWRRKVVAVSAIQGRGLEDLCRMIVAELGRSEERLALPAAFTVRQAALLREAATSTDRQAVGAKLLQVIGAKGFKQSSG